jgi:hypothetical protein
MSKGLPTHLIGTQAFLPALLSYIRNVAAPVSLPLDHVIFQSILLCLVAGDKHLILRTPEEDVGLVVRLTVWVSSSGCDVHQSSLSWKSENCSITASPAASPILDQLLVHEHLWVWPSLKVITSLILLSAKCVVRLYGESFIIIIIGVSQAP